MNIPKNLKRIFLGLISLLLLNACFFIFLMLTYRIPTQDRIKENISNSLFDLQYEQKSPLLYNAKEYWNDFGSDLIWINMATVQTDQPAVSAIALPYRKAFDVPENSEPTYIHLISAIYSPDDEERTYTVNYSRYWMIMAGVLRIFFYFWEITDIRAFFFYVNAILMLWLLYRVATLLGWKGFVPLGAAMLLRLWAMNTMCLSTMPDILLTTLLMLIISYAYDKRWFKEYGYLLYLTQGALSFSVGPLVAPLLTLGMPMILQVLLTKKSDRTLGTWLEMIENSACWVIGYAGSLLIKALLAKMFVGSESSSEQVVYYLGLGQGLKIRLYRIWYCIEGVLTPLQVKVPLVCMLLIILFILAYKKGVCKYNCSFQIFFLSLYPVLWAFVIVEHSIHYFVANIFSIFVFGVLSLITFHIKE